MWSSEQCSVNTWWSVVSQPPTQWAHIRLAHMPDIDNDDDKCTMMMMMMFNINNGDVDMMHCSGAATSVDVFCSFGKRTYV